MRVFHVVPSFSIEKQVNNSNLYHDCLKKLLIFMSFAHEEVHEEAEVRVVHAEIVAQGPGSREVEIIVAHDYYFLEYGNFLEFQRVQLSINRIVGAVESSFFYRVLRMRKLHTASSLLRRVKTFSVSAIDRFFSKCCVYWTKWLFLKCSL
jgi:hypothetical protein